MLTTAPELPRDVRQSLEAAVRTIVDVADPDLVILFGSWVEGRARDDSDMDMLVVADTDAGARLGVTIEDAVEPLLSPRGLDLIVVRASDWPRARRAVGFVTHEADQRGVKLYERAA